MTNTLEPRPGTFNCTGQGCDEREECLRWVRPPSTFGQKWASFDLERRRFPGPCVHRIWFEVLEGSK